MLSRILYLFFTAILVLSFSACGGGDTPSDSGGSSTPTTITGEGSTSSYVAITLNQVYSGHIGTSTDESQRYSYYTFTTTNAGDYTITASNLSTSTNLNFDVYTQSDLLSGFEDGAYDSGTSGETLTLTLDADTVYYLFVSSFGSATNFDLLVEAPYTPTSVIAQNLSATDGTSSTSITITWDAVTNASMYLLFREYDSSYEDSFFVSSNSYTDTDVFSDYLYTYYVKAMVDGAYEDASNEDTGYIEGYAGYGVVTATLSLDVSTLAVNESATGTITATATTDGTTADTVTAASSATAVATVSVSESVITVTGVSAGTATVTVTSASGESETVAVTVEVPVVTKQWSENYDYFAAAYSFDIVSYNDVFYSIKNFYGVSAQSYDGTTATELTSFYDGSDNQPLYIDVDSTGKLYVLSTHSKQLADASLYTYENDVWTEISTGFDDFYWGQAASAFAIYIYNDEPIVLIYRGDTIYIRKFSSGEWVDVKNITQIDTNYDLSYYQSTIDSSGNIYVAYYNHATYLTKIAPDGTTSDISLSTFGGSLGKSLEFNDGKLYVAYNSGDISDQQKATLEEYSFTTDTWQKVGIGEFSKDLNYGSEFSIAFDSLNNPYVTLYSYVDTSYPSYHELYVYTFDGSDWSIVGDTRLDTDSANYSVNLKTKTFIHGSDIYVMDLVDGQLFHY